MSELCSKCDKPFSLMEEGCAECGYVHDPMAPQEGKPLDFNDYEEMFGDLPLTPSWDGEDE